MKKTLFAVALTAVMTVAGAVSAFAADDTLDCPGFWAAHTAGYEVTAEGFEVTCTSTTYADVSANWNTPFYVVYTADEAMVNGTNYVEYLVARSDIWCWSPNGDAVAGLGDGYVWKTDLTDAWESWESWVAANQAGVTVTVKAKLVGSTAVITMENRGAISTATIPVDTSKKVYVSLSGDHCTLTNIKSVSGSTSTPAKTGWVQENGKWFYYDKSGSKVTGWMQDGKTWYYLKADGSMATGWVKVGADWYYMKADGSMATGWVKVGNLWYHMNANGAMETGWVADGGKWYFMNEGGAMMTGWVANGGKWYYMNANGVMTTGWVSVGGNWYYMNPNGTMKTGWLDLKGTWYYLKSDGTMATGKLVIKGQTYSFAASGAWVK